MPGGSIRDFPGLLCDGAINSFCWILNRCNGSQISVVLAPVEEHDRPGIDTRMHTVALIRWCAQVNAVKALGGEVRLVGESYTETQAYAWEVAEQDGRTFIAPYDDPFTVAGAPRTPRFLAAARQLRP